MDDLRHRGLQKLHVHGLAADDRAVHGHNFACDLLAAALPGLYRLGFAKIQVSVLDGLRLKGQLFCYRLVPGDFDLQKPAVPQGVQ